jgi:hypothetical protein
MSILDKKLQITKYELIKAVCADLQSGLLRNDVLFNHKHPREIIDSYIKNEAKNFIYTNSLDRYESVVSNDNYPEEETYSSNYLGDFFRKKKIVCSWKKLKKENPNEIEFVRSPAKKLADTVKSGYDKLQKVAIGLKRPIVGNSAVKSTTKYNELCEILEFKGVNIDKSEFVTKKFHSANNLLTLKNKIATSLKFPLKLQSTTLYKNFKDDTPIKVSGCKFEYSNYETNKSGVSIGYDSDTECRQEDEIRDLERVYREFDESNYSSNYNSNNKVSENIVLLKPVVKFKADNYEEYENRILNLVRCDTSTTNFNAYTESDLMFSNSKSNVSSNSLVTTSNSDISQTSEF